MRLSDIPELQNYPNVSDFVEKHLSMQFGDVRSMLRLPLQKSGIEYGCNFAATATLCNLVSGISVTIFKPSKSIWKDRPTRPIAIRWPLSCKMRYSSRLSNPTYSHSHAAK